MQVLPVLCLRAAKTSLSSLVYSSGILSHLHLIGPKYTSDPEADIYAGCLSEGVKFLYCPMCKELRVKPWYAIRNRCQRCFGEATVIPIPNNWMSYATYVLYVVVPLSIALYLYLKNRSYLYFAIGGLVIMMVITFINLGRAEAYARTRIKTTVARRRDQQSSDE